MSRVYFNSLFWPSDDDAQLHVRLLHQSHKSSAKAVICLTTLRRQLDGSLQLIILPLLLAVCTHPPESKLPLFLFIFLHCMWKERPQFSDDQNVKHWAQKSIFVYPVSIFLTRLSHANILCGSLSALSPVRLAVCRPSTYWAVVRISWRTRWWEQIGGLDKWHEY